MAFTDAFAVAEQEQHFRHSHPADMAEIDWLLRYLADDFDRAYKRLSRDGSDCHIMTLTEPHHYMIVPTRLGQVLGRVFRRIPGQDLQPVPLQLVPQYPHDMYALWGSKSEARPAPLIPFKRPTPPETTQGSLLSYDRKSKEQPHTTDRYKWYHPFGT